MQEDNTNPLDQVEQEIKEEPIPAPEPEPKEIIFSEEIDNYITEYENNNKVDIIDPSEDIEYV